MLGKKLLATLTVIAATAVAPGSAAARGSDPDPVRPYINETAILTIAGPSGAADKSGQNALGTRAGGEVISSFFDIPAELTSPHSAGEPTTSNEALIPAVKDGTANTITFAERVATPEEFAVDIGTSENIAADGPGARYLAQASALSASEVHASQVSPAFSGDAYTNEMGIKGPRDGAPTRSRGKVNIVHAVPEIGDEVLTFDSHTRPHADGIIAILIGAVGINDDRRGQDDQDLPRPRR